MKLVLQFTRKVSISQKERMEEVIEWQMKNKDVIILPHFVQVIATEGADKDIQVSDDHLTEEIFKIYQESDGAEFYRRIHELINGAKEE